MEWLKGWRFWAILTILFCAVSGFQARKLKEVSTAGPLFSDCFNGFPALPPTAGPVKASVEISFGGGIRAGAGMGVGRSGIGVGGDFGFGGGISGGVGDDGHGGGGGASSCVADPNLKKP